MRRCSEPRLCHSRRYAGNALRMPLADGLDEQPLAPVLVVALRAREIHLAVPLRVERAAALERGAGRAVDAHRERHAARLVGDVRGRARAGRRTRAPARARPAAACGSDRCALRGRAPRRRPCRRRDSARPRRASTCAHRRGTTRSSVRRRRPRALHSCSPRLDPQQARIRGVVVLHRAHVGAGERDARAQRRQRQRALLRERGRRDQRDRTTASARRIRRR